MAEADMETHDEMSGQSAAANITVIATDGAENFSGNSQTTQASGDPDAPKLYVNGKAVSEDEYMKAARENGYNVALMPPNYRPSISTKESK